MPNKLKCVPFDVSHLNVEGAKFFLAFETTNSLEEVSCYAVNNSVAVIPKDKAFEPRMVNTCGKPYYSHHNKVVSLLPTVKYHFSVEKLVKLQAEGKKVVAITRDGRRMLNPTFFEGVTSVFCVICKDATTSTLKSFTYKGCFYSTRTAASPLDLVYLVEEDNA